ncbi:hypothetical protein, partial [Escherichia coli]|uniref:hypothetical protein n=1 Tax=Escherichia coli TaxID=562 RepID=UPI001BE4132F
MASMRRRRSSRSDGDDSALEAHVSAGVIGVTTAAVTTGAGAGAGANIGEAPNEAAGRRASLFRSDIVQYDTWVQCWRREV